MVYKRLFYNCSPCYHPNTDKYKVKETVFSDCAVSIAILKGARISEQANLT